MDNRNFRAALVVVTLAITLPYILAASLGGPEQVFTGFLVNPMDGASYLAKMQQGYGGSWSFTLPFTAEPGQGTYIFLYYLFLGKLSLLSGLSLQLVFHMARVVGAWFLMAALRRFFQSVFEREPKIGNLAFWLAALGSGMGWLVVWLGEPTTDFWVAEAYPFLSMFTNPHFALGLALVVSAFNLLLQPMRGHVFLLALDGLLVSIIFPFGLVVALAVGGLWLAWQAWVARPVSFLTHWAHLVSLGILGGPSLLYQYWVITTHPVLSVWNAQNITPSPALWDLLLSFSPALLMAGFSLAKLRRQSLSPGERMLVIWLLSGLILVSLPVGLQRRFILGWYIPAAGLAAWGIDAARAAWPRLQRSLIPIIVGLSLPTNILVLLIILFGILSHAPEYYLHRDEARALQWLRDQTPEESLVLASPELAQWIPGWTGRRVIYGHPFETVNAEEEKAWVESVYQSNGELPAELLDSRGVDYIIAGPRERDLGDIVDFSSLPIVFTSGLVEVRSVQGLP